MKNQNLITIADELGALLQLAVKARFLRERAEHPARHPGLASQDLALAEDIEREHDYKLRELALAVRANA